MIPIYYYKPAQKQKILIVDDSEINRSILADMLGDEYEIIEAENGIQAIAVLQQQASDISLILLDMVMPKMNGLEVLDVMKQNNWNEDIPVVMISTESASAYVQSAYEMGAMDFIVRPFDALIVQRRVANMLLLYTKQKWLSELVEQQIYDRERNSTLMIDILSHVVEFRNGESGLHVLRVRVITELLLKRLIEKTDRYGISQEDIFLISTASALHDIGKNSIDESILNKPGKLTSEEFEIIKKHTVIGDKLLKDISIHKDEPMIKIACEICRWHHERYDGSGYPDGLSGDDIPISAQIVSLADVYDALTSKRSYKDAYSHDTTIKMILDGQCGVFNPLLLEVLQDIEGGLEEELKSERREQANRQKIRDIIQETLHRKNLTTSERTLRLLDRERMKYNFFADMSKEIQFEYTVSPPMITLTKWGADKLGLDEFVMYPKKNEKIQYILGVDEWENISRALRRTTPDQPVISYECKLRCNDQLQWYRVIARSMWTADDSPEYVGAIGKAINIHDSRVQLEELEKKTSHDMLTNLLNAFTAKERIVERLTNEPDSEFEMIICDLDKFKSANDNYGHHFGNLVLKHVAEKLQNNTRGDDLVARIGGDEFMLFLQCGENSENVIQRIFLSMIGTYENFPISMSMGVAQTSVVGRDYETLFNAADKALYYSKRSGRSRYCFYDESMSDMLSAILPIDDQKTETDVIND